MVNIREVYKLFQFYILTSTIVLSGCLPAILYSPKVCDPWEMSFGGSLGYLKYSNNSDAVNRNSLFYRLGLPNHFDIGIESQFLFFFPSTVSISLRKQFDMNSKYFNNITLGISYAPLFSSQVMTYAGLNMGNNYIIGGVGRDSGSKPNGLDGASYIYAENSLFTQFMHDFQFNRFHFTPYIYYSYTARKEFIDNPWSYSAIVDNSNSEKYHSFAFGILLSFSKE